MNHGKIKGLFTLDNVIPVLDKVQKRKRVRKLNGDIIIFFSQLLANDPEREILSFTILAGYLNDPLKLRMSHYDRTRLQYDRYNESGMIWRENSYHTFNGNNPLFSINSISKNLDKKLSDIKYSIFYLNKNFTEENTIYTFLSHKSNENEFFVQG